MCPDFDFVPHEIKAFPQTLVFRKALTLRPPVFLDRVILVPCTWALTRRSVPIGKELPKMDLQWALLAIPNTKLS